MKNLLRIVIAFNAIWITAFVLFQITTFIYSRNDGKWNKPLSIEQYIDNGGHTFDYYFGYAVFTSNNTINKVKADKMRVSLIDKCYVRYIYLLFLASLWFYGYYSLYKIQIHKYPTENDLKRAKSHGKGLGQSSGRHYVVAGVTTLIYMYGVYYCVVYIKDFWLM